MQGWTKIEQNGYGDNTDPNRPWQEGNGSVTGPSAILPGSMATRRWDPKWRSLERTRWLIPQRIAAGAGYERQPHRPQQIGSALPFRRTAIAGREKELRSTRIVSAGAPSKARKRAQLRKTSNTVLSPVHSSDGSLAAR